jgi:hypothetical protein
VKAGEEEEERKGEEEDIKEEKRDHRTSTIIVGFEALTVMTMKNMVLWLVTPCSWETVLSIGGTYRLHLQGFLLVSCLAYSFTLKMVTCFSERPGSFRSTRCYSSWSPSSEPQTQEPNHFHL